jgi:hypothetical protein
VTVAATLTADAVRALAPDASALKAGQGLANPRHWVSLGRSEAALWGACQGSGKEPYQVAVDLAGPAAKCTCPSRKFPCKHGLGLMFIAANEAIGGVQKEPPEVAAWLEDRAKRATAAVKRETAAADDPKAAAARTRERDRRAAQREDRVAAGMAEFRRWLEDLARRGLADVDDYQAFEAAAARLVDAQAGELARDVRSLAIAILTDGVSSEGVLDRIGRLNLVCETWDRRERLDAHLGAELRSRIGWTVREADLPDDDAVTNEWVVVARRHEDDARLRETRTWLRALEPRRWAVLIDFAPKGTAASNEPPVGTVVSGRVAFYPGASGLRGALRPEWTAAGEVADVSGFADFTDALNDYAAAVARDPFVEIWPVAVDAATVWWDRASGRLTLVDAAGLTVPLRFDDEAIAGMIAFCGGRPISVAGEWDGRVLTVAAAGDGHAWIALPGTTSARSLAATFGSMGSRKRRAGSAAPTAPAPVDADPAWAALVSWTMLGTGRAAPDPILAPLVDRMADRSPEQRLLAVLSALTARRRVARALEAPAPGMEPLEPAPAEARPRPPRRVALALTEDATGPLMDERLRQVDEHGWIVPPELLPSPLLAPPVSHASALGNRAGWLSRYVTGYRPWGAEGEELATPELVERLETPSTSAVERQAYLRTFRRQDPAAARSWLVDAWPKLSLNDKAMVAALEVGLSDADQSFLETVLAEKNADRRKIVASLLARLPASPFVARAEARGRSFVERKSRLSQGLRLMVPPEGLYVEMEADGCVVPLKQWSSGPAMTAEERALLAFVWHVGHVAPRRWSSWLGMPTAAVAREFGALSPKGYGVPALVGALANAAIAHRDASVAVELIDSDVPILPTDDLWALVPERDRERLVLKHLRSTAHYEGPGAGLRSLRGQWSRSAIATIDGEVIVWVGRLTGPQRWEALGWLRAVATFGPLELLPSLVARLESTGADSRDIISVAESRRRFAATVAKTGGT